jgi:hypothetical protein
MMSTLTASRSDHLVQPGAPPDERDADSVVSSTLAGPYQSHAPTGEPDALIGRADKLDRGNRHVREIAWACEWWPPI